MATVHSMPRCGGRRTLLIAVGLVCTAFTAATLADESENGADSGYLFDAKYILALGGYFAYVDSDVRLEDAGGGGTPIDLEGDLGLDRWSASAWLAFNWRFKPRHQLHLEWFQLNRTGNVSAQRDLDIGGSTFTAGVALDSKLDINIGRVSYAWSFIRDERNDVSFIAGVHVATMKATMTGTGNISVDGAPIANVTHTESSSTFTFPLPHFGFGYSRKLSPKMSAHATGLAFALDLDSFGGYLIELDGTVAYQVTNNFGVGGGLKYYNVNVMAKSSSGDTVYDMWFLGPTIFVYGSF